MGPAVQQSLAVSSATLHSSASAAPFLPASYDCIVFMAASRQDLNETVLACKLSDFNAILDTKTCKDFSHLEA